MGTLKPCFLVVMLATFGLPAWADTAKETPFGFDDDHPASLLFRSGFEVGVKLEPPVPVENEWEQYLTGADEGYDWSQDLPYRPLILNKINYLVPTGTSFVNLAESRIVTVDGRDGHPTRALYMELRDQVPDAEAGTRVQYGIYPPSDFTQAYSRHWLKLQDNLETDILPPDQGRTLQLMEWKETGPPGVHHADFRFGIYITRHSDGTPPYWVTWAQFGDLYTSPTAWMITTTTVPVPVGEWFLFEVFWKLGVTDGQVTARVNSQPIVDFHGQTQLDSGLHVWWPFKVYAGSALEEFGGEPIYQWVDDFELFTAPPQ